MDSPSLLASRRSRLLRHRACALKRFGAQARRCVQRFLRERRYGSTKLVEVRRY